MTLRQLKIIKNGMGMGRVCTYATATRGDWFVLEEAHLPELAQLAADIFSLPQQLPPGYLGTIKRHVTVYGCMAFGERVFVTAVARRVLDRTPNACITCR